MRFDLFCQVIDNHGDAGVCWRLARELARRGQQVRLWIDDASALAWMAPGGDPSVEVLAWANPFPHAEPGDVVIEAFGCDPPGSFVEAMARRGSLWVNLEYLSAEPYVERSHGLPSPVRPGIDKFFFYPGFTQRTGGLLREAGLLERQATFDPDDWLARFGAAPPARRRISLFCYEPQRLAELLGQLSREPTQLYVTAGRAAAAVQAALPTDLGHLSITWLPLLSQEDYDHLLWACDFNFVRGEDSLVRAIWAGKPFAWQLYPQDDDAHHAKLEAFLRWLRPPEELAALFRAWNGASTGPLALIDVKGWQAMAEAVRQRALALPELTASLLQFANERGRI